LLKHSINVVVLSGLVVSVLPLGPRFTGRGRLKVQHAFLQRGRKAVGPMVC
jgi:hypothetical protein